MRIGRSFPFGAGSAVLAVLMGDSPAKSARATGENGVELANPTRDGRIIEELP